MTRTTSFKRGELALVRFVFADDSGAKRRPVLVLSSDHTRDDLVVVAVTSNLSRKQPGEHVVKDWESAGLPKPSLVTSIFRTIKRSMIDDTLGRLSAADMLAVEQRLRDVLGL